jgi:hypothetical protein
MTPLKYKNVSILLAMLPLIFLFNSCDDEYGPRKESTPVIESASITENFTFGSSVTLKAVITDPATVLSTLSYEIQESGRIITSGDIPISGSSAEVSYDIYVYMCRCLITSRITLNLKCCSQPEMY